MRFGLTVHGHGPRADKENMLRLARLGEELKYDSIWLGDHVFFPYTSESLYPYSNAGKFVVQPTENVFETFVTLAYLAALVQTPRIGIGVLIIPYRNPVVTAQMMASLDVLSGGRLILGAGVGWLKEEFDTLGASWEDRGSVTDEYLQIYKELWTKDEPNFQGKHYQLSNIGFYPKPLQKPHPPIWIGGYSVAAMRRAVHYGDGWHPSNIFPELLAKKIPTLRRLSEEAGRDPDTIEITAKANVVEFGGPGRYVNNRPAPLSGSPQQMLDALHQYEASGVTEVVVGVKEAPIEEMVRTAERFADEIIPKV